ncbi:hypothetical protein BHYA_0254g00110 [Botrytis hyacinthi]|uniref:Uncharacterized protein n=1 Tax=Botrytis hyacinthi TaxID=278943 RepID=A0A4Z1G8M4_9HELO|nr:hypothetical protein BHYA_0254g00110 [Botrytis hyacinthi]
MSSSNPERRSPKRKSSNDLDGEYSRNQADVSKLDYGSPARSTNSPNLFKERDTEREKKTDDIDEAMRRRRVANEETDEIVESFKKKVDTFKEKISALEAKVKDQEAEIKKLGELNNRLRRKNSMGKSESKGPNLERGLEDKKAEISGLQRANSRLKDLLRDEKFKTAQKTSEAKMLKTEKAEQDKHYQILQGIMSTLSEKTQSAIHDQRQLLLESSKRKTETNALTAARQNLQRDLDEANRKLSVEVENGKSLQSKFPAEIARTHVLREEKHTLGTELEDKKKLLDTIRRSFRAIKAFANDETLDS